MKQEYDIIVVGGGAAGLSAAKTAHGMGKRVAIVEQKDRLGGECTWTGCVPSKTLIHAARMLHEARNTSHYGRDCLASARNDPTSAQSHDGIDSAKIMNHVRSTVQTVYNTHTPDKIAQLGIDVHMGSTHFLDAHTMQVGDTKRTAKKFIIATGSSPLVPPIDGLEGTPFLTNETLFDLHKLPASMIILGGGPIGIEMASALTRLGVRVTLIEMRDRILMHDDPELARQLMGIMHNEGTQFELGMKVVHVSYANQFNVTAESTDRSKKTFTADTLLVATGRKPNIEGLSLEKIGVHTSKRGIITDATLRTSAHHIWACGDVVGPYQFSHMAWYQGVTAARNAIIPFFKKNVDYTHVIWATFSAPELASAGLSEEQAHKEYGDRIQIHTRTYAEIDRGHTDGATNGMVKIITKPNGTILGAHILGERAGDIIHTLQVAKVSGVKLPDLHRVIHAYPTYAEIIWHISKQAYANKLRNNPFIRILRWIAKRT